MSASVARSFALVFVLQGHNRNGLRLRQIAEQVKQSASTTLRDLQALAKCGITERVPAAEDCWRLSPRIVQVAIAHQSEVAREEQSLSDFNQRYTRQPK